MWVQILCGLLIYKICKRIFYDDDVLDVETSDSNAIFSVASRLEKLYRGKAYVGLRIPDPDTGSRQNIDIVLITKGEAVVISVKNLSGFVSINGDGSWVCEGESRHKGGVHPDPVAEARKQASILESYLEQRGVALPEGYLSYKVIVPNPKFRIIHLNHLPPEVITYDQWTLLKSENKNVLSGWIKGAFRGGKKEMQESIHQQLNNILSTAPIWDRLELKGNKYVLGEFLEFKGKQEDIQELRSIKRSKVSGLVVQKTSMFGLAPSRLQVLYSSRDYRSEGASGSEWNEVNVRSSTEVLFQPQNSSKVRKFKLSSIISMSLSA
ncbi:NERD domain-containing protein [Melia azedarach]|uniref:NERD domain-containing protein n=1 Tax=Melia azedarach TaxID=155640 RepID=A0ACC1YD06_MELAZ|nr:NERD domain-containing protein [Melia azedarach]